MSTVGRWQQQTIHSAVSVPKQRQKQLLDTKVFGASIKADGHPLRGLRLLPRGAWRAELLAAQDQVGGAHREDHQGAGGDDHLVQDVVRGGAVSGISPTRTTRA